MLVVAKSLKGQEFLYNARSSHAVPKTSAKKICQALNDIRYELKDDEVWHVHEVDQYDIAFLYAEGQKFCFQNKKLVRYA